MGMEVDPDGHGGEGVAGSPRTVASVLWVFPFLSPVSVPKPEGEAILTP